MTKRDRGTVETRAKLQQSPIWVLLTSGKIIPEHADAWNELEEAWAANQKATGYVLQKFTGKGVDCSNRSQGFSDAVERLRNKANQWFDLMHTRGWGETAYKAVTDTFSERNLHQIALSNGWSRYRTEKLIRAGLQAYCELHQMVMVNAA